MATQPNVELDPEDRPRTSLPIPPSRRWAPSVKPAVVTTPDDVRRGPSYGAPGPDTGFALRLIHVLMGDELPRRLVTVLAVIMGARASVHGRAPISEDLEVAKILCGLGDGLPAYLGERRERWLRALSHESRRGETALSEIDADLWPMRPEEVRRAVALRQPGR